MAHLINFNETKKTYSFVSRVEKPWHGLGTVVEQAMTAEEAVSLANLDYEVAKTDVVFNRDGAYYPVDNGMQCVYRTDNNASLGVVKGKYEIVQNKDAFQFFDAIVDRGEAIYETAGVLGKGEKIFIMAKLPNDMLVKGEAINKYILLTNSHDGTSSLLAGFTSIRVVCNNTLQAALRGLSNKVAIPHFTGANEKVKTASTVMGIASKYMDEVNQLFNKMAETKIHDDKLVEYIKNVLKSEIVQEQDDEKESTRYKNMVDSCIEFTRTHNTQITDATKNTVFGAYNGISGYYNYVKTNNNPETNFRSQMFGQANKKILKAFDMALEIC